MGFWAIRGRVVTLAAAFVAAALLPPPTAGVTFSATVVVYGGTPSGVMAAVAARRSGASSVVLLEPTGHVGGMMGSGLVATDWGDKSTIGGITREFFSRMEAIEGRPEGRYYFQPKNAELIMGQMLAQAGVTVRMGAALGESAAAVTKSGARIASIRTTSGDVYSAHVFIDATYEGDLMARAGVGYSVGREPISQYNEPLAGVRPSWAPVNFVGDIDVGFPVSTPPGPAGSGDGRIQASNFRACFSVDPGNVLPFSAPPGYDPDDYTVIARYIDAFVAGGAEPRLSRLLSIFPTINAKFDVNDAGPISISVPGANYGYPDGTYAEREAITAWHRAYTLGFFHFLRHDPRVPSAIRTEMSAFGLCRDEWTDNGNWPYLLYLREGRRMSGMTRLTSHDITDIRSKPDIVAIGSYRRDAHYVSRWIDGDGRLLVEGAFPVTPKNNYAIPYSIMTPRPSEANNLLVTVTSSATHVAMGSLRMEPQYMMMGEGAGTAAAIAVAAGSAVQAVSVPLLQSRLKAAGSVLADPGDIGSTIFYHDIVWAYFADILDHCAPGKFCPTSIVSREMMADFLVRALDLPPADTDYFTDDSDSPFHDQINALAQSGITRGCTVTTFCPQLGVSRDQMASFFVRSFGLSLTSTDYFTDDDGSIHERDINRLAASGITAGCGGTLFCPARVITRGEMMAFLNRAM